MVIGYISNVSYDAVKGSLRTELNVCLECVRVPGSVPLQLSLVCLTDYHNKNYNFNPGNISFA